MKRIEVSKSTTFLLRSRCRHCGKQVNINQIMISKLVLFFTKALVKFNPVYNKSTNLGKPYYHGAIRTRKIKGAFTPRYHKNIFKNKSTIFGEGGKSVSTILYCDNCLSKHWGFVTAGDVNKEGSNRRARITTK